MSFLRLRLSADPTTGHSKPSHPNPWPKPLASNLPLCSRLHLASAPTNPVAVAICHRAREATSSAATSKDPPRRLFIISYTDPSHCLPPEYSRLATTSRSPLPPTAAPIHLILLIGTPAPVLRLPPQSGHPLLYNLPTSASPSLIWPHNIVQPRHSLLIAIHFHICKPPFPHSSTTWPGFLHPRPFPSSLCLSTDPATPTTDFHSSPHPRPPVSASFPFLEHRFAVHRLPFVSRLLPWYGNGLPYANVLAPLERM